MWPSTFSSKVATSLGHTVSISENGLEAVEATEANNYDAILMDVQMPIMDGLEAIRRIVAQSPDDQLTHIIAITANAIIGDREACLASGMNDYLTKPLRIAPLKAALSKVPYQGSTASSDGLIDREQFEAIVDPGDAECLKIFEDFCQLGRQQIDQLTAAIDSKDWQHVGSLVHQLKSSSSTLGFLWFSDRMDQTEAAAKNNQVAPEIVSIDLVDLFSRSVISTQST